MDPISLGLGIVGLGMSIFGGLSSSKVSGEEAQVSKDEATQEQGINNAKQQQMEIEGQRAQIQNVRNLQRARAQGLNAATGQGAQYGSGLAGGQAGDTDQALFNMQGVNDSLMIGRQINSLNNNITQDKYSMANLQGQGATDQGIASLGGSIMKAGPMLGAAFGGGKSSGGSSSWGNFTSLFQSPTAGPFGGLG